MKVSSSPAVQHEYFWCGPTKSAAMVFGPAWSRPDCLVLLGGVPREGEEREGGRGKKRKRPTLANPILAILIWPGQFWPIQFLANPILDLVCVMVGPRRVGPRKRPKFRAFFCFSLSRLHFRSLCLSLWVSSCGILVVLKRRDPQMCTFGVLGLSCGAFVT